MSCVVHKSMCLLPEIVCFNALSRLSVSVDMASDSGCSEISVYTPLSQRLNDDSDSLSEDLTEVEINGE